MNDRDKIVFDLRARYGEEVPVLDRLPDNQEIARKRSRLEFLAGALGYQRGMWKTWDGRILALIVIPATMSGYMTFWQPKVEAALTYAAPYVSSVQHAALELSNNLIGFGSPPDPNAPLDKSGDLIAAILAPNVTSPNRLDIRTGLSTASLVLWRITSMVHPPLDGQGARLIGGRWNSPGRLVLYTADSALGAIDEVMFYRKRAARELNAPPTMAQLLLHKIHAEGAVQLADKPFTDEGIDDWSQSRALGDRWFDESNSPILAYPSTFAPNGYNFVLNLTHPGLHMKVESSYPIEMPVA